MKTLEVTDVDTGRVLDRVHLSPDGKLTYETGLAQSMLDTLIAQDMDPSQAFDMRIGWSNGYIASSLV